MCCHGHWHIQMSMICTSTARRAPSQYCRGHPIHSVRLSTTHLGGRAVAAACRGRRYPQKHLDARGQVVWKPLSVLKQLYMLNAL